MFDFRFDWNDKLLIHIDKLDGEHKEFFRIGREIEQLIITRCIGADEKQLLNIVCELREFISYHFYSEEQIMKKTNYSNTATHVKAHKFFADKILNIDIPALAENPYKELTTIKELLKDWAFDHMMEEDKRMAEEVKHFFGVFK